MQTVSRMIRIVHKKTTQGDIRDCKTHLNRWQSFLLLNRLLVLLLIAGVGFVTIGCSSPSPEAPNTDQTHPGRYANPAYSASTAFHGTDVNVSGTDGCMSCHGRDLAGTDTVPGCTDCHFDAGGSRVPPGSNWIHGLNQHRDYPDDQTICNRCHDNLRRFGQPPAFCHNCHGSGLNHILDRPWLDRNSADFHGSADLTDCGNCHELSAKCGECHFGTAGSKAPPASGWTHGNNGAHQDYGADQDVCNRCHELDRSYGIGPVACHDCHGIVSNHALGQPWLDTKSAAFHGSADLTNCASCHDLSTKCGECHFGAAGNKAPPASGWVHGNNSAHENYSANQSVCNRCHDLDRSFANGPTACHDCHGIASNHVLGQPWLDTKSAAFHGRADLTDCASCHYLDATCSQCHFGPGGSRIPPGTNWNHGNNSGHRDLEAYDSTCSMCHTVNRTYGNNPRDCHDCHET